MATIYRTAQEYADELAAPPQKSFGEGGGLSGPSAAPAADTDVRSTTSAQPDSPNPLSAQGPPSVPSTLSAQPSPYTGYTPRIPGSGPAPTLGVHDYVKNPGIASNYEGLFAPLTKDVQKTTQGLKTTAGQFGAAAGARRTYGGIGGENILGGALTQGGDESKGLEDARSLVNSRYTGPQALDVDTLDALYGTAGGLRDVGRSLGTGAGVQNLIRQRTSGLTGGELQYEGRRLQKDPGFQASRRAVGQDIGGLAGQLGGAEKEALRIGAERTTDEEDIARQSRGYVEGRQAGVDTQLDESVRQAKAYDEALEAAYQKFRGSGNPEDLRGAPGVSAADLDKLLADPTMQRIHGAETAQTALQEQFRDIQDVPFFEEGIGPDGRWTTTMPAGWAEEQAHRGKSPEWIANAQARAAERQKAYVAGGFAGNLKGWAPEAVQRFGAEGVESAPDYSDIAPLYGFGTGLEPYTPTTPRQDYAKLAEGTEITKGSVANWEQRFVHDRASKILELNNELEAAAPYEKRQVASNILKMIDDQVADLEGRRGDLTAAESDYLAAVKNARGEIRKAKRKKHWNKLSRAVLVVTTLGTYEVARPITGGGAEGVLTGTYANP